MTPRASRLRGGLRIGADFFERRHALAPGGSAPRGLVDGLDELAHAGIDVDRVHPAIVTFFCDTASLELHVRSEWRFPFSLGWRLVRGVMRAIGQFVLPLGEGTILTRVLALDEALDGRPGARAIVRTYADTGEVMQAVAYATCQQDGTRYMSAAFPMPGGQMLGILRLDVAGEDAAGNLAVALTSRRRAGDAAGVWFVIGPLIVPSPFGERLALWSPDMPDAPRELAERPPFAGATIAGLHEQRLFGIRFVTHRYWFRPLGS